MKVDPQIYKLFFVVYSLIVLVSSVMPSLGLVRLEVPHLDKVSHFLTYFLLFVSGWLGLKEAKWSYKKTMVFLFVYCFVMGILTETLQGMTSYRMADFWDFLADILGATAAFLLIRYKYQR